MGLILASASPRRKQLLEAAGVLITNIDPADIDEHRKPGEPPLAFANRVAREKAQARTHPEHWVLGADTIVHVDDDVFGKPRDRDHAVEMLTFLQGRTHLVTTAWTLVGPEGLITKHATTEVTFRPMLPPEIDAYINKGESMDKAGAYAAQGDGVSIIAGIDGCLTNVIGLPLPQVLDALSELGLR